jgi:hypothetical protein
MSWYLSRWCKTSLSSLMACLVVLGCVSAAMSQAQSSAADLQGTVRDQNGAVVATQRLRCAMRHKCVPRSDDE